MPSLNDAYINALLADASYVGLVNASGVILPESELLIVLGNRLTPSLAEFLLANFEVLNQELSPTEGFDAVVWKGKADTPYAGKVYVSTRGTQGMQDNIDDLDLATTGLAHKQLRDMVNWWLRETTPAGQNATQIAIQKTVLLVSPYLLQNFVPTAFTVKGTGALSGITTIESVNGHSLGGYLTASFARLFGAKWPVKSLSTFNSAGFSKLMTSNIENGFNQIAAILGAMSLPTFLDENKHTNYFAENGINVTTNDWDPVGFQQYGKRIAIYQEDGQGASPLFPISNHFMFKLTDVLALGTALEKLDSGMTIEKLNAFTKSGSNVMKASYEGVLDAMRRMLVGINVTPTQISDNNSETNEGQLFERIDFHKNLKQLTDSTPFKQLTAEGMQGKLTVKLGNESGLAAQAPSDFGVFASLYALSPVVISTTDSAAQAILTGINPALAQLWQEDATLRAGGKAPQNFTDQWLEARAKFLETLVRYNTADGNLSPRDIGALYEDQRLGIKFGASDGTVQRYVFADDKGGKVLSGLQKDDFLFGGAGIDTLRGGFGNDYLEGGLDSDILEGGDGEDKYVYTGAGSGRGGNDHIIDSDGKGTIWAGDKQLTGITAAQSKPAAADGKLTWTAADGTQYQYTAASATAGVQLGGTLDITKGLMGSNATDKITIERFNLSKAQTSDGYLGIKLGSAKVALAPGANRSANPFSSDFDIKTLSTGLAEGGGRVVTAFLSAIGEAAQTITLKLSGADAAKFSVRSSAGDAAFQGDELTLSVAAGQDSSTFTLISNGDVDSDATITLAARVNGADADPAADPARLTVNFKAVVEADPPSDTATYTGTAEGEVIWAGVDADDEGMVHHTAQAIVNGGDGNDFLSDGSGQDETDGGAGNDLIVITGIDSADYPDLAGQAEHIVGGAGNDLISLADTMAEIDAGSGSDIVIGQGLFEVLASTEAADGTAIFIQLWPLLATRFDPRILTTDESGMAVDAQDNATPQLRAFEQDFSGTLDSATTLPTSFANITYNAGTTYAYSAEDKEITITPAGPDGVLDASAEITWTVGLHYSEQASEKSLTIDGGEGNDALVGNGGADEIEGGEGNDRIYAGAGDDTAFGDEGDDKLYLGDGADYADGGDGNNPRNVRMRCAANLKSSHHHRPARRMDRRSAARALRRMACTNGFDGVVGLRIAQKRALNETSQQNSVEFLGHGSDKTGFDFCSKEMSWWA